MLTTPETSKEHIRKRILQHALDFWKLKDTSELDPAIKLMMEALAVELSLISNELEDTRARLLERLAGYLTPEILTAPVPAHAVMRADPVDGPETLLETSMFSTNFKCPSAGNAQFETEVFFSPIAPVKILGARIAYIVKSNELLQYDQANPGKIINTHQGFWPGNDRAIWLGLAFEHQLPASLSFYFDMGATAGPDDFSQLALSEWSVNGRRCISETGRQYSNYDTKLPQPFDRDVLSTVCSDVAGYYHQQFTTVQIPLQTLLSAAPAGFQQQFGGSVIGQLSPEHLWVKIDLPPGLNSSLVKQAEIHLNAFPVINRSRITRSVRLKGSSNIIPLKMPEHQQLLSVISVSDAQRAYSPVSSQEVPDQGTYAIRFEGLERFDRRNARDLISHLVELIRSESAAFAAYGYDFIASTLKELEQRMVLLEQKTGTDFPGHGLPSPFVVVQPHADTESLTVAYWATNAAAANGIPAGAVLHSIAGNTKKFSLQLLSPTVGGRHRLAGGDRLRAFRHGIASRNRIVTIDDIRSFCFFAFGDKIASVFVEKAVELSVDPREGFMNVVKINLIAAAGLFLSSAEKTVLANQLITRLQARSGIGVRYRVAIAEHPGGGL